MYAISQCECVCACVRERVCIFCCFFSQVFGFVLLIFLAVCAVCIACVSVCVAVFLFVLIDYAVRSVCVSVDSATTSGHWICKYPAALAFTGVYRMQGRGRTGFSDLLFYCGCECVCVHGTYVCVCHTICTFICIVPHTTVGLTDLVFFGFFATLSWNLDKAFTLAYAVPEEQSGNQHCWPKCVSRAICINSIA